MKQLSALIIMDGYGIRTETAYNAVFAGKRTFDKWWQTYPHCLLQASGEAVGLPKGQMGNSEVGHLNLGAGRIVYQELSRISNSIASGAFFRNEALTAACESAKANGGALHCLGLLSDGGVHSHADHLYALLKLAKERGVKQTYVHCFTDGRDVAPTSAVTYLEALQQKMDELQYGCIADVCGRYYAMDRDNRWERVRRAYEMLLHGVGTRTENVIAAIRERYAAGQTDEFLEPIVCCDGQLRSGDAVVFFNFRPDRARELTRAFTQTPAVFEGERPALHWVCMTQYDATFRNVSIAFEPEELRNTLGEWLSKQGKTQLRIAETEKYAHVTFFFNGGVETPNKGEDRILVPSPKVATYDLQPQMSAEEVTKQALEQIERGEYDVLILNFANCDMVGHTGNYEAAVQAVAVVDECVDRLLKAILANGGRALLTADHGNAEKMMENGMPFTAHTTNPVPLVLVSQEALGKTLRDGRLCDVAPTLLTCMNLPIPPEMTGKCLLCNKD